MVGRIGAIAGSPGACMQKKADLSTCKGAGCQLREDLSLCPE